MTPEQLDAVNALFELVGVVMVWSNVAALVKARRVEGVFLPTQAFFTLWGGWNMWYYLGLGQTMSFLGQVGMVIGHALWLLLAVRWRK